MRRFGGRTLRVAGWLLTPLVVWAASFVGAWLAARAHGPDNGTDGLLWLGGGAVVGGTAGLIGWILVWRRVRRRHPTNADKA